MNYQKAIFWLLVVLAVLAMTIVGMTNALNAGRQEAKECYANYWEDC